MVTSSLPGGCSGLVDGESWPPIPASIGRVYCMACGRYFDTTPRDRKGRTPFERHLTAKARQRPRPKRDENQLTLDLGLLPEWRKV